MCVTTNLSHILEFTPKQLLCTLRETMMQKRVKKKREKAFNKEEKDYINEIYIRLQHQQQQSDTCKNIFSFAQSIDESNRRSNPRIGPN